MSIVVAFCPQLVNFFSISCFVAVINSVYLRCVTALADETLSYVINGGWRLDWAGEYQLNNVIVVYERSNQSADEERVSLRHTPVDLNVFVSILSPSITNLRIHSHFGAKALGVHASVYGSLSLCLAIAAKHARLSNYLYCKLHENGLA